MTTKKCEFTIQEALDMVLLNRPFVHIKATEPIFRELHSIGGYSTPSYVIENEAWSVGYDNQTLPKLPDGEYRLWNTRDWVICDNRNQQAIVRLNALHDARVEQERLERATVRDRMIANGVTEQICDMLITQYTNEQIHQLYVTFGQLTK